MVILFSDYFEEIVQYHLYASKSSEERQLIREKVLPVLETMDAELGYHQNFKSKSTTESVSQALEYVLPIIQEFDDFDQFHLQYFYFVVDYLFLTPVMLDTSISDIIPDIADTCVKYLKPYVILHDLAVLSWYDTLIEPHIILTRLKTYDLTLKEIYHVIGELSLRFPELVMQFQKTEQILDNYYQQRLIKKLRTTRKKKLNKDMEITMSLEQVNELIENYF